MAPVLHRTLSSGDKINVSGVVLASGIGVAALLVAFATFRLQQYMHRRLHPPYELEAAYELHSNPDE
jgi:hypothetical protein